MFVVAVKQNAFRNSQMSLDQKQGPERIRALLKVTQPGSGKGKAGTQLSWPWPSAFFSLRYTPSGPRVQFLGHLRKFLT